MRETMDEVQLADLAESIKKVGVVEPLVVEKNGKRYRVIAGHRRLLACQIIHLSPVPCVVREPGAVDPAAVTIAENYYREDVNPVEEAAFLARLLHERCGDDTDVLAALIRHGRTYVEDRLLLLQGDARVLDALKEHKITLAVARELNRYKDSGTRLAHLDAAISGGATAAVVRNWRAQSDEFAQFNPETPAAGPGDSSATPAAVPGQLRCMFCQETDNPHMMSNLWLHTYCEKILKRMLEPAQPAADEGKG